MAVQNPIGIALAGLLSLPGPLRVRGLYRTIIFLPTTLSVVIVGFSWNLIVSPLWGKRGMVQIEAMTLADRILVMNHGQIEQVGKPLELYYAPETCLSLDSSASRR